LSTLRAGENCLFFPAQTPEIDLSPLAGIKPRPGEFWAVLDPPRTKTEGGILLRDDGDGWSNPGVEPEDKLQDAWEDALSRATTAIHFYRRDRNSLKLRARAAMLSEVAMHAYEKWMAAQSAKDPESPGAALTERSDAYTIARVGEGVPLVPGDRVILAPYAARRLKDLSGVKDVCLVGLDDPWQDVTILLLNPLSKVWEPVDNWIGVKIAKRERAMVNGKEIQSVKKSYHNYGEVACAGPGAESKVGQTVLLHRDRVIKRPDNSRWFGVKWSPWDNQGLLFVRESDSEGFRRVLGVIE